MFFRLKEHGSDGNGYLSESMKNVGVDKCTKICKFFSLILFHLIDYLKHKWLDCILVLKANTEIK